MPSTFHRNTIWKLQQVLVFLAARQSAGYSSQKSGEPFPRPCSFGELRGLWSTFWFLSPLVICWLLWSSTQLKKMSAFPQNIPLCFFFFSSAHIVLSQRAISLRCHGEISAPVLIYIPLSLSWKGNHLPVERNVTALSRYDLSPPPPTPTEHTAPTRLFAFIVGRGNGCLRASVCKCMCVWSWTHESFLFCASSTAGGPVCGCVFVSVG